MSRLFIMYVEALQDTITITFINNSALNHAGEEYQGIFFPNSRTVYLSDKRYEEYCQLDSIAAKKEFFQHRVWHYEPSGLPAPEKLKELICVAENFEKTIDGAKARL